MIRLTRDSKTGDYYFRDYVNHTDYMIEKGYIGWNVKEKSVNAPDYYYKYSWTADTLKEVRASIEYNMRYKREVQDYDSKYKDGKNNSK